MTTTRARTCTHPPCTKPTRDPSGRCHHHRATYDAPGSSRALPTPTSSSFEPAGYGLGHEYAVEGIRVVLLGGPPPPGYTRTAYDHDGREVKTGPAPVIEYVSIEDPSITFSILDESPVVVERHFLDGEFFRADGGPTEIIRRQDGSLKSERWQRKGDLIDAFHRHGAPASIHYDTFGARIAEMYAINGDFSRLHGPAGIYFGADGRVSREEWFFRGMNSYSAEGHYRKVALTTDEQIREHLIGTPLEAAGAERPRDVAEAYAAGVHTVEGVLAVLGGAPTEWARSFESASSPEPDNTPW